MKTNLISGRFGGAITRGDETIENFGSMPTDRARSERWLRGSRFSQQGGVGDSRFPHDLIGCVVGKLREWLNAMEVSNLDTCLAKLPDISPLLWGIVRDGKSSGRRLEGILVLRLLRNVYKSSGVKDGGDVPEVGFEEIAKRIRTRSPL